MADYKTPGVYIVEQNAFRNSAVAVETAVPVFIGYTETASFHNNSLVNKPTRITSFAEYLERFGPDSTKPFTTKYSVTAVLSDDAIGKITPQADQDTAKALKAKQIADTDNLLTVSGEQLYITAPAQQLYLYNSIRLFFDNGGSTCYIMAVGTYGTADSTFKVKGADIIAALELLKKEEEPTLVLSPDAISLGADAYNTVYTSFLDHCNYMQSRFSILDLAQQGPLQQTDDIVAPFRDAIGINYLNYGAAYYPWVKTAIVTPDEVGFKNIDITDLSSILPEQAAKDILTAYANVKGGATQADVDTAKTAMDTAVTAAAGKPATDALSIAAATATKTYTDKKKAFDANYAKNGATIDKNLDNALKAASATFVALIDKIRTKMNELPPSGAMAGIYTAVDNNRGVWKAPANVSVNMVNAPSVNVTSKQQENLNVDVQAGKSINVIRAFPGVGTLVWGGRTLDGNSQDWRYVNVRRTLIMIEQSLKLASRAYVFEPNDANTWITVKSMFDNFLTNLWKQGALAGAVPEQAFSVAVGLGSTMTGNDILDGKMLITVKVAIVRPAEFIEITFQQQMQQS
jgi:phage tail sheath protein FI